MEEMRLVDFNKYCAVCKNKDVKETDAPCCDCMDTVARANSRVPEHFDGSIEDANKKPEIGYYDSITKVKDYLYEVTYDRTNFRKALEYFKTQEDINVGACSAIMRKDGIATRLFGRNYDWYYSNQAEFVVKTRRFIGVAGGFSKLTNDFVESGKRSDLYYYLPFQIQDGMNMYGLCVSINVVPTDKGINKTKPKMYTRDEISALMLPAYILNTFITAADAVHYINNYVSVYFPTYLHDRNYEVHYLISDPCNTYVLEFVNNRTVIITDAEYITNFHIIGVKLNNDGSVYTPETSDHEHDPFITNHITPYGSGLERYNLIAERISSVHSRYDLRELLNDLKYTKAYKTADDVSDPYWYSEFVGGDVNLLSSISDFNNIANKAAELYSKRSRDTANTWHTMHSSIYDMNNFKLYLVTQEDDVEYEYDLKINGGNTDEEKN